VASKDRRLQLLETILSQPSCPFHEQAVVAEVRAWAKGRGVRFRRDPAGNVVLRRRRGARRRPNWVFTAHMDHPGFLAKRQRGRSVWAEFRGWVFRQYFLGSRVRFFAPGGEVCGTITARRRVKPQNWWACRLELDAPVEVPPGTIGMWDVPAFRRRGGRILARACDDLAGTAAVVCALDEIAAGDLQANVTGLLTRAEEAGFVGALAACRLGTIPPGALVVSIEASKAQPGAPVGGGAVLRVGDRMRTFDASLEAHVSAVAAGLARRGRRLRFTRQLMPGGACESTVFSVFGHRAAALCLPLGNYHNMGADGRIRPEQIDAGDFASLVALLVALAADGSHPDRTDAQLRARLAALLDQRSRLLDEP
jgi:endoglucanase